MSYSILLQTLTLEEFYTLFLKLLVSFFCGFVIGIERTRVSAQYGARDHIFFSMISTSLIILYENYIVSQEGFILIILILSGMIIFLFIGSIYRLFRENDPGYTTTLSMLLAIIVGILCFYNESLAIAISVFFLIILSTKKQFNKIRSLQDIEWQGTIEFIAIIVLLYILIPDNLILLTIEIKPIITIFIIILAIKYFSYFILKSSFEKNLYYISFLGGFAHSEATTIELAEAGASSSSVWLVIQTMLFRMIVILLITPTLLYYALYPIVITIILGLLGSFLILRKKKTKLDFEKIKNPLSLKSAAIFAGTYFIAVIITILLKIVNLNIFLYYIIVFCIGFLSGGASSLFVATSYGEGLINNGNALIMLSIGLSAAILNKLFYSTRNLKEGKDKRIYALHLILYISITISILVVMTIFTIYIFSLPIF